MKTPDLTKIQTVGNAMVDVFHNLALFVIGATMGMTCSPQANSSHMWMPALASERLGFTLVFPLRSSRAAWR